MTHIDETCIECRHDFFHFPGVDVAYGVLTVLTFLLELNELLPEEQKAKLSDYEGREVVLGVRPENINEGGSIRFNVTNNENLGMNTLVHGKIGTKIVVCKFAKWCNYKFGDVIDVSFQEDKMHFFEKPVMGTNDKGEEIVVEYGKAIGG